MNRILCVILAVVMLVPFSVAGDLPDAPSSTSTIVEGDSLFTTPAFAPRATQPVEARPGVIDKKFIALAIISTGSTFADSYTTLFARENWLAGKSHVCNVEVESPYLYGKHPTVVRAYAVASGKSVMSAAAAYYLRKRHFRLWSLPLVANAVLGLQGVTQNMITCN